jgi:site-specific DNA-methyltransferase (adenine-specific)
LEFGTGALNIDGTRIGTEERTMIHGGTRVGSVTSGATHGGYAGGYNFGSSNDPITVSGRWPSNVVLDEFTAGLVDEQSAASRFFYVAKASKRDRNEGLDALEEQRHSDREKDDGVGGDNPRNRTNLAKQNFHPTVKPTDLMRQLVRLVTPPGGVVLDPFTGSGSTGKAAILEGFEFIGCELTEEYLPIIEGRLNHAVATVAALQDAEEEKLF